MSKIIYVCYKDRSISPKDVSNIQLISSRITPDNIEPNPTRICSLKNLAYGIINPTDTIEESNGSVAMGKLFGERDGWAEPLNAYPDGSFALFRQNLDYVELVTDVVASRTIWYFAGENIFVASTSQRAIVMLLKEFKFNKNVLTWVLSTGSLGPENSWDSRIKQVPPDSAVILDRRSWEVKVDTKEILFKPADLDESHHVSSFCEAMLTTFKSVEFDFKKWVLPLSGGYDSRCILLLLHQLGNNISGLRTFTWGLAAREKQSGTDAFVAKQLSDHYEVSNIYLKTDRTSESLDQLFKRFFINGEGRIDHVAGYLDGFKLWKDLFELKVQGIIRGDVCLTSKTADNPVGARNWQGFSLCSELKNLKNYESFGFAKQEIPAKFNQRSDESLEDWRDRLYQQFRIPTVLSALSDLKLSYVEVLNPLLSREIIMQVRSLPTKFRNEKKIIKDFVNAVSPAIPMAKEGATIDKSLIFNSHEMIELLSKELKSDDAKSVFPATFIDYVIANYGGYNPKNYAKQSIKSYLKKYLPSWLKKKYSLNKTRSLDVSFHTLAFRIYTVLSMERLLREDAACLSVTEQEASYEK